MDRQPLPVEPDQNNPSPTPGGAAESPVSAQPETPSTAVGTVLSPEQIQDLEEKIVEALKTCFDPEIPVNIYELGLIYGIDIQPSGAAALRMTLTSPACPAAGSLPPEVQAKVAGIPGIISAKVDVVWDPPWDKDLMSEAARLTLGIFD